jgi:tetratricopeptide (TPR) repeat protein
MSSASTQDPTSIRVALDLALSEKAWGSAEASARSLIALAPTDATAHHHLAISLWRQERFDEATDAFERSLEFRPRDPAILNDYALLLAELGGPPGSLEICQAAVETNPGGIDALNNRGIAEIAAGKVRDSLASYNAALRFMPNAARVIYNRNFARLLLGDFKGHCEDYEARFAGSGMWDTGTAKQDELPLWQGEPIRGLNLLIHAEQGFGDVIQYLRFIPLLAMMKPARLTLHIQAELLPVLATMRQFAELHPIGTAMGPCHFSVPIMSLPHRLGTDWNTLPAWRPYVAPEPERVAYWRERLARAGRERDAVVGAAAPVMKVGLVWRGFAGNARDRVRSLSLRDLYPLAHPLIRFVSLQKGPAAAEAAGDEVLRPLPLGDEFHDFGDTAALISQLDLVVTIDTSVAHLSGALGHPTWILTPHIDFKWLINRDDSPWYPSVRLFRQPARDDWAPAIELLAAALHRRVDERLLQDKVPDGLQGEVSELLEQGRTLAAAERCHRVLVAAPGNGDALLGAARAAQEAGQLENALRAACDGIDQHPQRADMHLQHAQVLQQLKRPFEALGAYHHALARDPNMIEALRGLAQLLRERGLVQAAQRPLDHLLKLAPEDWRAQADRADCLFASNNLLGALRWARESLNRQRSDNPAQALESRCLQLLADNVPELGPAIAQWRSAGSAREAFTLAEALLDAGVPEPAVGYYRAALTARQDSSLLLALSDCLVALADWQAAAELGELSGRIFPTDDDLRSDYATALWKLGRIDEAEKEFSLLLARTQDHLAALLHGSAVARERGDVGIAVDRAERALRVAPQSPEVLLNAAAVAEWQGDDGSATKFLDQILKLSPDHRAARFNRGLLALRHGRWEDGWVDYEARADVEQVRILLGPKGAEASRWAGEDLSGKHIVVCCEQGLGDTLQFLRFLPALAAFGAPRVTLQVQDELLVWVRDLSPPVRSTLFQVMPRHLPLPPFDVFLPLLSLPGVLGVRSDQVPVPHLPPIRAERRAYWREWLSLVPGRRIGLCWAGNPAFPRDRERSPGLSPFAELLAEEKKSHARHWVAMVVGPRVTEGAGHGLRLPAIAPALGFADSSALVSELDLLITSDTALAHLAAGLGRPTWLLVADICDWRWGAEGDGTLWYPSMRIFRQPGKGDWRSVIEAVRQALNE